MTLIIKNKTAKSHDNSHTDHKENRRHFYGGPSPEHDVSVVTALQIYSAIDRERFDAELVYITPDGRFFMGDALKERSNYVFDTEAIKQLTPVTLDTNRANAMQRAGRIRALKKKLFAPEYVCEFDIALPAFHGLYGEDGNIQGLFEQISIPYVGMRTMMAATLMDKAVSKHLMQGLGIDTLPCALLTRQGSDKSLSSETIEAAMKAANISFPCILKPTHLAAPSALPKLPPLTRSKPASPLFSKWISARF